MTTTIIVQAITYNHFNYNFLTATDTLSSSLIEYRLHTQVALVNLLA